MIQFQYYSNSIDSSQPVGWVTLEMFINATRNPKPSIQNIFTCIADCEAAGDMATKAKLKEGLYSFTPCVHVGRARKYSELKAFTGLLVLDFDHISNAIDFKDYLFHEYTSIIACWLSPSKKGVKALVKIPVVSSIEDFKSYYFGIANEMWQYNGFDGSGQNSVLPLFQSWDPDILVRDNYSTWTAKGYKVEDFTQATGKIQPVVATHETEQRIIKMINTGIDKIVDNGHPQLRGVCFAVGGYVANGYISESMALDQIYYKIENNAYLRKGVPGYKKTAKWALESGVCKPLAL